MKERYYAVKEGRKIGVFDNWDECHKSIDEYPGAKFKGFNTREEAEAYMIDKDLYLERVKEEIINEYTVVYTDGSYCEETKKFGYAMLIFYDDKHEEYYGSSDSKSFIESKNVAGEVFAVINALDWCVSHEKHKVKIFYDYEGIEKIISGEWNGKQDISKFLKNIYDKKYKNILQCEFEHVKAHSNNKYNERADFLAKSAARTNMKKKPKFGDGWFTVSNIELDDFSSLLDIIKEDNKNAEIIEIADKNALIAKEIKIDREKIIVKLYSGDNKTLLIQGNEKTFIFQLLISYIFELLDIEKVERMMSDAYRITIDKKDAENQYQMLFKNIPNDVPTSLIKLLKQSLINLRLNIDDCYDYSFLLTPAYRALDGVIKYIFEKNGTHIKKTESFTQFGFDSTTNKYFYKESNLDEVSKYKVEKCYNFFKEHRNAHLHFGELISSTGIDDTMIISKITEAYDLLRDVLNIIAECIV